MVARLEKIAAPLHRLEGVLQQIASDISPAKKVVIERWQMDAAALRFHLRAAANLPDIKVVIGGTGTGKSTLVNRLVGAEITATSFRRTFTTGPVAVARDRTEIPRDWLGIPHTFVEEKALPARGQASSLVVVESVGTTVGPLIDTPDLDGDQPAHHAQADRAFRWAQRLVFVVTPEKYQMTELIPYYRLARRYEVPAMFVMNKCEEPGVVEDFRQQLAARDWAGARLFIVARDDAAYEPAVDSNLQMLRHALESPEPIDVDVMNRGRLNRARDVAARLVDQIINPLREGRRAIDEMILTLRGMETPPAGVDVNPITQQLQRRLQQRSVLYLMGPRRVLDRVRQMPLLAARLPRAAWDWVMRGEAPNDLIDPKAAVENGEPPDFPAVLADQFTVLRSRIDDCLRSDAAGSKWIVEDKAGYEEALLKPGIAAAIGMEEIENLRKWLETRWNATPRDTRMLQNLLKYLPGGKKLTKWSEAAPYLLTLALVMHGAIFGHLDLMVLGGYSVATWLSERISNEVAGRTRATNRRIAERFEQLAHEQIGRVSEWLNRQAPETRDLNRLDALVQEFMEIVEAR
jgi:hypothetical protein